MKINFITVCTDEYPLAYAEKITKRLKNISYINFDCYCITDRPSEVTDWATPIKPYVSAYGWWNKLNLFSPRVPKGWCLYLDLDIVIAKNFDKEILWCIENTKNIACVSDALNWMGEKFSSSFMLFRSGSLSHVFDNFKRHSTELVDRAGGDQVWVGPQLQDVLYVDETFPNLKKNLKFHIALESNGGSLTLPKSISNDIKMIDCGGRPKPHELTQVPYIFNNWHNIA